MLLSSVSKLDLDALKRCVCLLNTGCDPGGRDWVNLSYSEPTVDVPPGDWIR